MELQFTKDAHGMWVSEFEVSSDFNLHIERTKGGIISLYQRTNGGGWDHVDAFEYVRHQASIDFDCAALVYPKWCKIESEVEPSYAAITTDGEVTEIKSQSKEVEITANGVTEIAPDAGFGYLSGVKVNVNVPQSGGGESGGGGTPSGGTLRFYSITNPDNLNMTTEYLMPSFAKANGMIIPAVLAYAAGMWDSVSAVASDVAGKIYMGGSWRNLGELLDNNASFNESLGYIEITEEEFYNLEA